MAKVIKTGILYREYDLQRDAIDAENRTVNLAFSSELPVERYFGMEVLDHSAKSVNLSRLNGRAPLLLNHDPSNQIGVVESASVGADRIGRATVRFSRSKEGKNIFRDVQDGIRSLVSVGYRVNNMTEEDMPMDPNGNMPKGKMPMMRVTDWTPMEISIVSIPADPTVGVGRSQGVDERQFETTVEERQNIMATQEIPVIQTPVATPVPSPGLEARQLEIPAHLLSEDVKAIRECAAYYKDIPGIKELARLAEFKGDTFETFRRGAIDLFPKPKPVSEAMSTPLALKPKDIKQYSLSRAIMQKAENRLSGLERELDDEIAGKYKHQRNGAAFWVPAEVMGANMERSFVAATGTLGGMLVQTTNLASEFIEVLRNKAQVMRLGARALLLDTPVTIPRQAAAGAANWVGETVAATLGTGNFQQITLTPNGISAFQQYGAQLLATNNPSIDAIIRDDIMNIIALAIDLAALHGSGSPQPTGIIGTTGIGSVLLGTNGLALNNATAYPAMVSLESLVSTSNADQGALAYLARSNHRGMLKVAQRFTSTDSPVWTTSPVPGNQAGNGANDGQMNGYRAAVTNQIATNLTTGTATTITSPIFFGNWNELLVGQFNGGATEIIVDPYVLAVNSVVRIIARHWVDIGVRHPASFAVLGGVLGG